MFSGDGYASRYHPHPPLPSAGQQVSTASPLLVAEKRSSAGVEVASALRFRLYGRQRCWILARGYHEATDSPAALVKPRPRCDDVAVSPLDSSIGLAVRT